MPMIVDEKTRFKKFYKKIRSLIKKEFKILKSELLIELKNKINCIKDDNKSDIIKNNQCESKNTKYTNKFLDKKVINNDNKDSSNKNSDITYKNNYGTVAKQIKNDNGRKNEEITDEHFKNKYYEKQNVNKVNKNVNQNKIKIMDDNINYKYKHDRNNLIKDHEIQECDNCKEYYNLLNNDKKVKMIGRHKCNYRRSETPPEYWDIDF